MVVDVLGSFFLLLALLPSAGRLKSSIVERRVILCFEPAAGFKNPTTLSKDVFISECSLLMCSIYL